MDAEVSYRGGCLVADIDTREHIAAAARWLVNPNSTQSLLLCGLYGNGKTTLARAISGLIDYITNREYGYSGRKYMDFYTAKDICRICAASEKFKDKYQEYDDLFKKEMIIIDDLGDEPKEVMVYGMIYTPLIDIISERYRLQLMTIITTNLDTDELKERYGERIYDRLREMLTVIVFKNDSYRTPKSDNKMVDTR